MTHHTRVCVLTNDSGTENDKMSGTGWTSAQHDHLQLTLTEAALRYLSC